MIRVSVGVSSGAVHFTKEVQAESIERAVRQVGVCYPGCEVRVLFPIDPEAFFAEDSVQWRGQAVLPGTKLELASPEPSLTA